MAKTKKPEETKITQSASAGGVVIGGDATGNIIATNGAVIHYYAANGEKREMRTGWFYGHRYGDLENFTGRAAEIQMFDEWLNNDKDNLLVLRALGGFGKSALAWTWFNRVDRAQWPTAVWWSFYEKESGFESFLSETLKHLGIAVKDSTRQQLNDLLEAMRGTNILIVLDGFERLLRQYGRMDAALQSDDEDADIDPSQRDCSSPLTETFLRGLSGAGMKSKVLMTTRLCPRVLESADGKLLKGCREEPLAAFSPEDAAAYFHKEGIKATRAEVIEACAAYGYHPLSLSLLVGLINEDHERRGDIAAVKHLEIFADVKARRHHVLERAYGSLAPERRDLLSKMSCFRGSMEYAALKKVFPSPDLDKALLDLRKRGLLQYAGETGRYDMHPIVRHYVYARSSAQDRRNTHNKLAIYFIDFIDFGIPATFEDIVPTIELYYHTVRANMFDEAARILYRHLSKPIYFQFGAYQFFIELLGLLFLDGKNELPNLKDEKWQGWVLNEISNCYTLIGQPQLALVFGVKNKIIRERISDGRELATALSNIAANYLATGRLKESEFTQRQKIDLCRKIDDDYREAIGHMYLGELLIYRGEWDESEQELGQSTSMWTIINDIQGICLDESFRALQLIMMARDDQTPANKGYKILAIEFAKRALFYAHKTSNDWYPVERDFVRIYWILGTAYQANGDLKEAEDNLFKAISMCRQINLVEVEANILLELARLRYAQGDFKDAQEKASEALVITERSGYVLQGADVNLFLATLEESREQRGESSDGKAKARKYAEEALRLAYCDGGEYKYKVAYEEAERLLERLKR